MALIAFYAGLCVGMLLGFLILSLVAFYLAAPKGKTLSDLPRTIPREIS